MTADVPGGLTLRRATETDHAVLEPLLLDWMGGSRALASAAERVWFRHFSSTSVVAETPDGRIAGFVVGFVSPDRPEEAVVVALATNPNLRRRGVGRLLAAEFGRTVRAAGVRRVVVAVPPDERVAVDFLRRIGFTPTDGPGTQRLYGVSSLPGYDGEGRDRALFVRELAAG